MARRPVTKPRKHATQERSRATVDALVEATARVLVREGFDKASTNRIAEVAGVSVGSLYQYFPCKEALVVAVIERHHQGIMQVVHGALAQADPQPIAEGVRTIIAAAIEAHRVDPGLHRVLSEQIPRTGRLEHVEAINREAHALLGTYLERHRDEIRSTNLALVTFVCGTTIEALSHTAVLHHPGMLTDEAAEALIDEAACLVLGYLQSSP
jgi:AcrR family transcriptional regulator